MLRTTGRLLSLSASQGAGGRVLGGGVTRRPWVTAGLPSPAGDAWSGLPHTSPAPLWSLHTTRLASSDSAAVSTKEPEPEPDRLYSMVEVECRGHEPAVLRSYQTFVTTAAGHLNIPVEEIKWPKKHIQRWTLLKSVFIFKKHRVQYETRTHFLVLRLARLTGSTADTFLEYIQRNLPEGVAMKVTTHEVQKLPKHVKPSSEGVA